MHVNAMVCHDGNTRLMTTNQAEETQLHTGAHIGHFTPLTHGASCTLLRSASFWMYARTHAYTVEVQLAAETLFLYARGLRRTIRA